MPMLGALHGFCTINRFPGFCVTFTFGFLITGIETISDTSDGAMREEHAVLPAKTTVMVPLNAFIPAMH